MDYDALIDAETWAFIHTTEAHYPPGAATLTVAEQRTQYDALCAAFDVGRPAEVRVTDSQAERIPIRIYATDDPAATVLYAHGGGFIVGGLDSHDSICAEIAACTGFRVIAVDYRLAPEHTHPAAYDDTLKAARWALFRYGSPFIVCGDSAGATLVSSVAHAMRGNITGQVLIYPSLGGDMNAGSYLAHADAPMLTRDDILFYEGIRCESAPPKADPTYAVLHDTNFTRLPPTVIFSAECDPLSDDGRAYRDRIVAAGGKAEWINEQGLVHGYLRARHTVARARNSFDRIVDAIRELGVG